MKEDNKPVCAITNTGHCHLQGIRYNAQPCAGECELKSKK